MVASFVPIFIGTPEAVIERLRAYEATSVTEVIIQWWGINDTEAAARAYTVAASAAGCFWDACLAR